MRKERVRRPAVDRFREKYIIDSKECWIWTASTYPQGYGRFGYNYKIEKAHRWSYEYFVGPIPEGKEIDHLCRMRNCVNPDHLEAVIHKENCKRGNVGNSAALRQRSKTNCPQGHPYNDVNTYWYQNKRGCKIRRSHGGQGHYLFAEGELSGRL